MTVLYYASTGPTDQDRAVAMHLTHAKIQALWGARLRSLTWLRIDHDAATLWLKVAGEEVDLGDDADLLIATAEVTD